MNVIPTNMDLEEVLLDLKKMHVSFSLKEKQKNGNEVE